MSLDMFANTFSQRSGIEQSMTSTIISSIIGHLTQQGLQNSLMSGNLGGGGGIQSALSNIGPLSPTHLYNEYNKIPSTAGYSVYATGCRLDE